MDRKDRAILAAAIGVILDLLSLVVRILLALAVRQYQDMRYETKWMKEQETLKERYAQLLTYLDKWIDA